ncbi:MAG: type IV pilus modification protein PilV [Herminiimonas sp.]|nr:type IV pilus modification protein PilV [Herminiimonas sp.]
MIETLVTAVIVSFGLLGIAAFQVKASVGEAESYQRAQAIGLLTDMTERIRANSAAAGAYVSGSTIGTGDAQPVSCASIAIGAARDVCEWSNALKGTSEQQSGINNGGLGNGRGCITQTQAADAGTGVCTPAIYRVSVAWLGSHATIASPTTCGQGAYGTDDSLRRVISAEVVVGLPGCS